MVVAQYTGIGLQKDDNAFVKYNSTTGAWDDSSVAGNKQSARTQEQSTNLLMRTSILR